MNQGIKGGKEGRGSSSVCKLTKWAVSQLCFEKHSRAEAVVQEMCWECEEGKGRKQGGAEGEAVLECRLQKASGSPTRSLSCNVS